jgi:hypothetical protein
MLVILLSPLRQMKIVQKNISFLGTQVNGLSTENINLFLHGGIGQIPRQRKS